MTTCGICGKRFVVTWPQHWVYRRKDVYLCGEDCMIVYDTQCTRAANGFGAKKKEGADEDMAGKLTEEQRNQAINIALTDSNPMAPTHYLKSLGVANPYAAWSYIKQLLKKNDPETLRKIEEKNGTAAIREMAATAKDMAKAAKVEKVNKVPEVIRHKEPIAPENPEAAINMQNLVLQGGVDYQLKVDEATVIRKPFKVTGLETDFGRFTIGTVEGVLRFQAPGETEISMVAEDWHKMAEVLPEILAALEV